MEGNREVGIQVGRDPSQDSSGAVQRSEREEHNLLMVSLSSAIQMDLEKLKPLLEHRRRVAMEYQKLMLGEEAPEAQRLLVEEFKYVNNMIRASLGLGL